MRRALGAALAIVACCLVVGALAQTQTVRDKTEAPTGTAVIAGTVVTDEASPRPVRRASVTLSSGELRFPQVTMTDDAGRFVFGNLAAGNYTIVATKPSYVPAYYGAKRAGHGPGVPIAILDGQQLTDITLRMLKGGVITGIVRGQNGQPAQGVGVQLFQVDNSGGSSHTTRVPSNTATDDRGVYRAFGLLPGQYIVQVTPLGSQFAFEARLMTPAEVRWADQVSTSGAAAISGSTPAPPPAAGATVAYAPVYYPGTTDSASAATVTVQGAEERSSVDFSLMFVQTAHVIGTVVDPDGRPLPGAQISLAATQESSAVTTVIAIANSLGARSGTEGRFSIANVTPGQYTLSARASPNAGAGRGGDAGYLTAARLLAGGSNTATWWASADVAVDGRDVSDVVLRLQPGMTVSGKIDVDDPSAPAPDVTKMRVSLMAPPSGASQLELAMSMLMGGIQASIAADGTFAIKGVTPNKYRLSVSGLGILPGLSLPGSTWTLKSAMLNGRDVADAPLEVKPNEDVPGLVVMLTDRPTELSGTVVDRAGRPAPGFPIVVFSTDRAYWTIGSRRIQQARPSSDGKYTLTGLPAGEYYVCAVTDLDQAQLYDPVFLEALAAGSFKITLTDGERKTQDLKLAGGG